MYSIESKSISKFSRQFNSNLKQRSQIYPTVYLFLHLNRKPSDLESLVTQPLSSFPTAVFIPQFRRKMGLLLLPFLSYIRPPKTTIAVQLVKAWECLSNQMQTVFSYQPLTLRPPTCAVFRRAHFSEVFRAPTRVAAGLRYRHERNIREICSSRAKSLLRCSLLLLQFIR